MNFRSNQQTKKFAHSPKRDGSRSEESGKLLGNSFLADLVANLVLSKPLLALFVLQDKSVAGLDNLGLVGLSMLGSGSGALSDLFVSLSVKIGDFGGTGLLKGGFPSAELALEGGGVLLKEFVVGLNVLTENVGSVFLGIEGGLSLFCGGLNLLALFVCDDLSLSDVVAWESLLVVGDEETTVAGTLHGTENSVTSGGAGETNIEESLEWAAVNNVVLDGVQLTVDLGLTLVHVLKTDVLKRQQAAGGKEASGVGSSVVSVASVDTEAGKLLRVSSHEGLVALDGSVDNLADYALVGSADDETVLLAVVLVLLLDDEASASLVVSLAFSATAPLGLISLGVCFVLEDLHECHCI